MVRVRKSIFHLAVQVVLFSLEVKNVYQLINEYLHVYTHRFKPYGKTTYTFIIKYFPRCMLGKMHKASKISFDVLPFLSNFSNNFNLQGANYLYIYLFISIYLLIYLYTHKLTQTHMCMCICICMSYVHMYVRTYMYMCIYIYIYIYIYH